MKRILKVELWKAFHNPFFYFALGIGMMIGLVDVLQNIRTVAELTQANIDAGLIQNGSYFASLFIWWIACNGITWGSTFFYLIWPLLGAMPYGWAFSQEIRSGMANQYMIRSNRTKFLLGKYWSVFISGGVVVALPVFTNLLFNALFCPAKLMEVTGLLSLVSDGMFLSRLYYTHPWCFCLIWCGMEFLIGGSTATLCFVVGSCMRYTVAVMLTPFVLCYLLATLGEAIQRSKKINLTLNPLQLAMATPMNRNPEWLVFSMIGTFSVISFLIGYWQVKKHELS